jgi:trehalose synthase
MLEQYRDLAPQGTVELLRQLGRRVEGKSLLHVNSTRYGGGVAEMLHRLLPLFEELGVKVRWEVMTGSDLFYRATAKRLNLDAEFAMIHDPQPAALIDA